MDSGKAQSENGLSPSREITTQTWELLADCTDYQRAWFTHYVGEAAFNASRAAKMAGSRAADSMNSGHITKHLPAMQLAITSHLRGRGIGRERILERIAQFAFADGGDSLDEAGRFSAERMRQNGLTPLLRKITYHTESAGGGVKMVEFESPVKALELLGRATEGGMFRDNTRVEHSGELEVEHREVFDYYQLNDDDLRELERLHVKATGAPALESPEG